jgi:hypothetical protein
MKWIDTTVLRSWATRRDCQENLPLLVRKLIRATSNSIKSICFPSGENILIGGWDGILEVYKETEYLPLGISLWEFGANADIKGKADDDYNKRKTDALGFNPQDITYVFITPRLWTKKNEWIAEKKGEGHWKDVKVYDAQDLEEWIDIAPSVGAWLAINHLGIFPNGVQSADDYWDEWSTGSKIRFIPDVVLAGRVREVEKLFAESQQPAIIPVKASSREEAIAFIVAAFKNDNVVSEDFFSRAVIIDTVEVFREIVIVNKPLYLIIRFYDDNVINRAKTKGHTVYVPLGIDNSGQWSNRIDLPALEREAFLDALTGSGLERDEAEKVSKRSARNLAVLRRQLEFNRLIPEWSHVGNVRDMIPAMLAERWDENLDGDRKVIESLAGEDYDTYIVKLKQWLYTADTPIVQIGSTWRLTSPLDAWTHAGKYCIRADFGKLQEVFLQVFGETDPKFELAPEERYRASWHGIQRRHSRWLREGLAQSMILISIYGDKIGIDLPMQPETWGDYVIAKLLSTDSPALWKSIDYELPLIAEASPASFIVRLEELIKIGHGPIHQLFEEEKVFLHSHSYHTGLLWALENIAWMPQYLTRVTLLLAELAVQDPGGTLSNRPINSLREIFKSWFPQSLASLSDRMEALKVIAQSHKEVGYRVLKSLLPSGHRTASPTHRMRWRLSDETMPYGISYDELYKTHTRVVELLLEHFDQSEDEFNELIEKSFDLSDWDRERVLHFLEQRLEMVEHVNNKTWNSLRRTVARHRTHPDAKWSLPEETLARYGKIYERLTPADPIEQTTWILRERWPEPIEGKMSKLGHEERAKLIHDKKVEAVKTLYTNYGLSKILKISTELSGIELQYLAFAVADVVNNEQELYELWDGLKTDNLRRDFAQYVIDRKRRVTGNDYVFNLYEELKSKGFEMQALTNIFLRLHADRQLWEFIDSTDWELIDDYWNRVDSFYFYVPIEDLTDGISRLMKYHRFTSAFRLASNVADQLDEAVLAEILMGFLTNLPEKNVRLDGYEIEHIFDELRKKDKTDHDTLIKLEWLYLPFLNHGLDYGNTPILHREMADNPEFFVQVLEQLYKTETDNPEEPELSDEQIQQKVLMAQSAYKLFQTWNSIPGVDKDGNIDSDRLRAWVNKVMELAKASDRLKFAEDKIGDVFAKYPETNQKMEPEKELNWPPDILCEVMEEINSESLFDNFRTSTYNKRGFSSRGPFDGGAREWHIAAYFKKLADLKSARFPHVGAILEELAKDFEQQARYEDERAERDRLDY